MKTPDARVTNQRDRRPGRILQRSLTLNLVACLTLILQFLLGMVVNLFVQIPSHHPGTDAADYFAGAASVIGWVIPHGAPWLVAHVILGLLLVIAGVTNLVWAPRTGSKLYTAAAWLGAAAILGAAFNGASFLNYGHDISSMIMAGLWALAISCYLTCLYLSARQLGTTPSTG